MEKYSFTESAKESAFPIARQGFTYILGAGFATAVFAVLNIDELALIGLLVTFFLCYFFRDPDRIIPKGDKLVVSPADGKIISIQQVEADPFGELACIKISIFMNVFNVHVNRVPHDGTVKAIQYYPGKFFNASLDKASADNERNAILLETWTGHRICFVQIAGLVARRIISYIQEGDTVARGQRFGIICLGSRLDVYLPPDSDIAVRLGDKVSAGTTVLANLSVNQ